MNDLSGSYHMVEKSDPFGLNAESQLIASYYYCTKYSIFFLYLVNHHEVKLLKTKYDTMKKLKDKDILDGSTFIQALEFRVGKFVSEFLKPFKDKFTWDCFFQFVVFISLSPMVAVIYVAAIILRENNQSTISWNDITQMVNKLNTTEFLVSKYETLFRKCENKTGGILFTYFFKFVDSSYDLWKPLYQFKIAILEKFFPDSSYKDILHRKLDISYIKRYQLSHHNKFPPMGNNCMSNVISTILNTPNKNRYDYDFSLYKSYRFSDITKNLLRNYYSDFENYVIRYNLKNLSKKTEFAVINDINEMYLHFNTNGTSSVVNSINISSSSRNNSSSKNVIVKQGASLRSTYMEYIRQSGTNSNTITKSILRNSSLKYTSSSNVIKVLPARPMKNTDSSIELNEKNMCI